MIKNYKIQLKAALQFNFFLFNKMYVVGKFVLAQIMRISWFIWCREVWEAKMHLSRKLFVIMRWSIHISTVDRKTYCPQHKILSAQTSKQQRNMVLLLQVFVSKMLHYIGSVPWNWANLQGGRDENMQSDHDEKAVVVTPSVTANDRLKLVAKWWRLKSLLRACGTVERANEWIIQYIIQPYPKPMKVNVKR